MRPADLQTCEREPIYWFALAERAVHRGDRDGALRALDRLRQLGVEVRYTLPLPPQACADCEAAHAD